MTDTEQESVDVVEAKSSNRQTDTKVEKLTTEKLPYKKPELRKYTQIDYVTAYGVD